MASADRAQSPVMASGQTGKDPGNQEFRKERLWICKASDLRWLQNPWEMDEKVRDRKQHEHSACPKQYQHVRDCQISYQK